MPSESILVKHSWVTIPDFTEYLISDDGIVWGLAGRGTINQSWDGNYWYVWLFREGKKYKRRTHVLMLLAFRGPRPPGCDGAHDDGNANNNNLLNLYWKTRSENIIDSVLHGTHPQARKEKCPYYHQLTWARSGRHRYCSTCDNTRRCKVPDCQNPGHDHLGTPWVTACDMRASEGARKKYA